MSAKIPDWLREAVFYEIYPQTFRDTNADGIGDINGITEKLPYIKELGCTAIWLNPCFTSPFDDAGYDVEDYYTVAPRYGTNEDLLRLFSEAHRQNMHVILDLVPGHTSYKHKWFRESMKPERNEYTDRYVWTDSVWEAPEGMGCLRGISQRNGAAATNFFSTQPALNYGFYKPDPDKKWQQPMDAPGPVATREAVKDIMRFWLKAGCDGFRVDMAGSLVKGDPDGLGTIALWQDIREFLDREFPEAVMVSEWGEPDKSLAGGFHMDFLLHFGPSHYNDLFRCSQPYFSKEGLGSAKDFVARYRENYGKTNGRGLICIPSGNHDMDRLAYRLDTDELKVAFAFLLSMPGAPFIYYGDEIGMRYIENLPSVEGGFQRTGSRTPMQWDHSLNAGFSSAPAKKLYLPVDPGEDRPDALGQAMDDTSLRSEVKRLIALRRNNIALQSCAEIEFLSDDYPLVYTRRCPEQTITVIINPDLKITAVEVLEGKLLYCVGGKAELKDGQCIVEGCTAAFVEL